MRTIASELTGLADRDVGASARSQLYLLFSDAFHVPDEELYDDVRSGNYKTWIQDAIRQLPYNLDVTDTVLMLDLNVDYTEFNSEFMRLFEVGIAGPNCPLHESKFVAGRVTVLQDLVRFYNFFDLSAAKARELPDHLRIELDFMHFLTFKEAEALHCSLDPGSFVRAERDFLQRHLGNWLPLLDEQVDKFARLSFFKYLTRLVHIFIRTECAVLQNLGEIHSELGVAET